MVTANEKMLKDCPTILNDVLQATGNIGLLNPKQCLITEKSRLYYSKGQTASNGKNYRMKMKLKQRNLYSNGGNVLPIIGYKSKYQSTVVLQKQKNNGKWKKVKPLDKIGVKLIGTIYKYDVSTKRGCEELFHHLVEDDETRRAKKLKIKWKRKEDTSTPFSGPEVLNADYWFTDNGNTYLINRNLFQ